MSAKKLLIFNWKMAPQSFGEAKRLLTYDLQPTTNDKNIELVVCPPFVYLSGLSLVVGRKSSVKLGAQSVFYENSGAYTGEISASMLKNLGVEYVIIGHSERRKYLNETDEMINKKILASLKAGLKVILCVGEPTQRGQTRIGRGLTRNIKWAKNYVKKQLEKDLRGLSKVKSQRSKVIVAYEPLWSIGTGHSDTSQDALEMIKFIKSFVISRLSLVVPVLYGGSVDSKNIANFLKYKEIDGALIGGASLKAGGIKGIIEEMGLL